MDNARYFSAMILLIAHFKMLGYYYCPNCINIYISVVVFLMGLIIIYFIGDLPGLLFYGVYLSSSGKGRALKKWIQAQDNNGYMFVYTGRKNIYEYLERRITN